MGDLWTRLSGLHETSKDLKTLFSENPKCFAAFTAGLVSYLQRK